MRPTLDAVLVGAGYDHVIIWGREKRRRGRKKGHMRRKMCLWSTTLAVIELKGNGLNDLLMHRRLSSQASFKIGPRWRVKG